MEFRWQVGTDEGVEIKGSRRIWRVNGQRKVRYWGGETDDEEERRHHSISWRMLERGRVVCIEEAYRCLIEAKMNMYLEH